MKKWICVLAMVASGLQAEDGPDGLDINSAIPIWFGQQVNDVADSQIRQRLVYRIELARGQKFTATARLVDVADRSWRICLYGPATRTVANFDLSSGCENGSLN